MHCFSTVGENCVHVPGIVRAYRKTEVNDEAYGDIQEGVNWKAAMHLIMSFGYFKSASEKSLSEAVKGISSTI